MGRKVGWRHVAVGALLLLTSMTAASAAAPRVDPPAAVSLSGFTAASATVVVALDDRAVEFGIERVSLGDGVVGVRGASPSGDRLVAVTTDDRILSGDVYTSTGRYHLAADTRGVYRWVSGAPATELDLADRPSREEQDTTSPVEERQSSSSLSPPVAKAKKGMYEIDVMVLQTDLYQHRYGNDAKTEAKRLVFLANTYFANSDVPIHYRLVHIASYSGTGEDKSLEQNLADLESDPAVAALRNEKRADLVALTRTQDFNTGVCGYARPFNGGRSSRFPGDPNGNQRPPTELNADRDIFTVSAVGEAEDGTRCGDTVFAHELGHNLGAGHDFANQGPTGWKSYAHGWECGRSPNGRRYASIMHYGYWNPARIPVTDRGDFFSDPDRVLDGEACGSRGPEGTEVAEADNSRALADAAPYVAAYR